MALQKKSFERLDAKETQLAKEAADAVNKAISALSDDHKRHVARIIPNGIIPTEDSRNSVEYLKTLFARLRRGHHTIPDALRREFASKVEKKLVVGDNEYDFSESVAALTGRNEISAPPATATTPEAQPAVTTVAPAPAPPAPETPPTQSPAGPRAEPAPSPREHAAPLPDVERRNTVRGSQERRATPATPQAPEHHAEGGHAHDARGTYHDPVWNWMKRQWKTKVWPVTRVGIKSSAALGAGLVTLILLTPTPLGMASAAAVTAGAGFLLRKKRSPVSPH